LTEAGHYQTNVIFWDPWSTLGEALEHVALLEQIRLHSIAFLWRL